MQTVTLSLPSSVSGYRISSDMNTAMVTIHDDENSDATGAPGILVVQAPGDDGDADNIPDNIQIHDNGDGEADTYSLGTSAVSGGQVAVGDVLVADLRSIADADGLVTAKGEDKMLGAVMSNGRVATDAAGAPAANLDDVSVGYQWGTLGDDTSTQGVMETDFFDDIDGAATSASYTVTTAEIGARIAVRVTIEDDATQAIGPRNDTEELDSGSVRVPPTLSIVATTTEISEGDDIVFTVNSNADLTEGLEVRVSIDTSNAPGVNLEASATVTIDVDTDTDADAVETTLSTSNTTPAEGKQTVTVSLPSALSGFNIDDDASSVTFTVLDTVGVEATGKPVIRMVQAAGTTADPDANVMTDDKGTEAGTDDTYSLATDDVPTGGTSVGMVLVADLTGLMDADGLDKAAGDDETLGAVNSDGRGGDH